MDTRPALNIARSARASTATTRATAPTRSASIVSGLTQQQQKQQPRSSSRRAKDGFGRRIWVYSNLLTNQVVYSLTRAVKNNHALRQLPYNGKKTVPAALRKDHWSPMAMIEFASSSNEPRTAQLGLAAFQKLREYRKLHETQWPLEFGKGLSRKERGRRLCDQKANSVADMAAALTLVTALPKRLGEAENRKSVVVDSAGEERSGILATVKWSDILDAEFAESWPEGVVHDQLEVLRNNRRDAAGEVSESRTDGDSVVL